MKKIIISSVLLSSMVFAAFTKIQIPLSPSVLSVENSGELSAIDAYRDGVGIYISGELNWKQFDNNEMNSVVYKYGTEAKNSGMTVKDYVSINGTTSEKALNVGKFEPMGTVSAPVEIPVEGASCDDNNAQTINDIYVGGICVGTVSNIYNHNGTIKCENANIGDEIVLDNVSYLVVDNTTVRSNLNRVATICTSKVTDMFKLFLNNTTFNQSLNHWDVSNVTNMGAMFFNAWVFNQPLDNWDVSKVMNMNSMFYYAYVFNQPLNNWNVGNVISMHSMFNSALVFNQPLDNWDVSKVTGMSYVFKDAYKFNQSLNNWNVGNVNNMSDIFYNAYEFNQPLDNWDVSKVVNMSGMFYNAYAFNQPLDSWDVSNANNMASMFVHAKAFNQPLNSWDVSKVLRMSNMFNSAEVFNQPLNNWNTGNVSDMTAMFNSAKAFNQYIKNWNVGKVVNFSGFRRDSALTATNSPL